MTVTLSARRKPAVQYERNNAVGKSSGYHCFGEDFRAGGGGKRLLQLHVVDLFFEFVQYAASGGHAGSHSPGGDDD